MGFLFLFEIDLEIRTFFVDMNIRKSQQLKNCLAQ